MFVAGKKRKLGSSASASAPKAGSRGPATTANSNSTMHPHIDQSDSSEAAREVNRLYLFGLENIRSKQYRNALDYCNRSIAVAKNSGIRNSSIFETRSLALYKLGEYQRAMDDAKEAVRINPQSAAGYANMANIMAATDKYKEALEIVERALKVLDQREASGYRHVEVLCESLKKKLDPKYVPKSTGEMDPVICLPLDINVLVFGRLDIRTLMECRAVCKKWRVFMDATPVLWSRPCFLSPSVVDILVGQLPAYTKLQKVVRQTTALRGRRVPNGILRLVFEFSQNTLRYLVIPEQVTPNQHTLDALFTHKRPLVEQLSVYRGAELSPATFNRILAWCLQDNLTVANFPYNKLITGKHLAAIARLASNLKTLDISGCEQIRMKQVFRAWSTQLTDAQDTTQLENLHISDHPEIPEFLAYSAKHRHFLNLRILHMAIRAPQVFAKMNGLGPLREYFERIPIEQSLFPNLRELNIDGIWAPVASAHRFESEFLKRMVVRTQIISQGLTSISVLDAGSAQPPLLLLVLHRCISTLRTLYLTRANGLDSDVLIALVTNLGADLASMPLQLVSLDLSNCAGASAHALSMLISRCPNLVYVNLTQTATDNQVLRHLTQFVDLPYGDGGGGLEVVVLDTTDVTGAAVRDFAAACARRFGRMRVENKGLRCRWKLRILDLDNCVNVGSDAVTMVRDLLSAMDTRVSAAVSG
ncbi:hypothetical protein H4R99_000722 [Coemansia sp. RSA 1722]|nr:hypothetical protein LPJ57_000195 [Coemansia sp. RSA 486]KAJ2237751.1 hypothetical protein IWW45_000636 [Coemansia sp. RSA 485]KAJ2602495.1 hypothetical protein GGF39_000706 [Coemansia sp. RSA 1721]KAJ2606017.1 hypothetical protein H4R99_000722 [Coemansia sp. RSA 1722]KAJ2639593.1 hypothetical protein GGF40_000705 [Coemansia sp. RSA 1286]